MAGVLSGRRPALPIRPELAVSHVAVARASEVPDPASGGSRAAALRAWQRPPPSPISVRSGTLKALMTAATIANALQRVRTVFARRPEAAIHAEEPAIARWEQGLRVVSRHANGAHIATDMPRELGGQGEDVTPGWLLRAALASCLATRIAMEAAARDIVITRLEVVAASESDARGLLGMTDGAGERVSPGPRAVQLRISISAPNVAVETLRTMIEESHNCSPVQVALERPVPVSLRIDIDPV